MQPPWATPPAPAAGSLPPGVARLCGSRPAPTVGSDGGPRQTRAVAVPRAAGARQGSQTTRRDAHVEAAVRARGTPRVALPLPLPPRRSCATPTAPHPRGGGSGGGGGGGDRLAPRRCVGGRCGGRPRRAVRPRRAPRRCARRCGLRAGAAGRPAARGSCAPSRARHRNGRRAVVCGHVPRVRTRGAPVRAPAVDLSIEGQVWGAPLGPSLWAPSIPFPRDDDGWRA